MKFGIWHDFRNPPRWHVPYDRLYAENLDQIAWAETLGYESVWVSEHHVTDDGYLPSVFPMLAAIAQRTTTMRLGSSILLGPFQHPIRYAEDVAVLDQLSGGRLEVGLGLGYRRLEFDLLGVPITERAPAHRGAGGGGAPRLGGRHGHAAAFPATGAHALGRRLRRGCGAAGRAPRRALHARCVRRDRCARPLPLARARQARVDQSVDLRGRLGRRCRALPLPVQPLPRVGRGKTIESADQLPRDRYLVGEPAEVAAGVRALIERTGCDRMFFWARPPGLGIELANRSLERFAREVMPLVR